MPSVYQIRLIQLEHLSVRDVEQGFSKEDELALEDSKGFSTKMDKALFADAIATSIGAIFGTSNTTTYVESAAGIGAGGRTGLTSVVVAILFALSSLFHHLLLLCQHKLRLQR